MERVGGTRTRRSSHAGEIARHGGERLEELAPASFLLLRHIGAYASADHYLRSSCRAVPCNAARLGYKMCGLNAD